MQLTQQPGVNNFAAALRRYREASGLSQRALAKHCGLTPAYVSLLEGGRRMPERPTVERLADALALTDDDRAALQLAAGYAPTTVMLGAAPGPLAEAETAILDPAFTEEQRSSMVQLTVLYARGLAMRARAGKPLVSDLAAPWQVRVLDAIDEKMAEELETVLRSQTRVAFDL